MSVTTAKITPGQARQVRVMLEFGVPQKCIAKKYKVSQASISAISTGRTWPREIPDMKMYSHGNCVICGKHVIDGLDDPLYMVTDDEYVCSEACFDKGLYEIWRLE